MPELYIDTAGGKDVKKKSGGFQMLYESVNVPAALVKKTEQDRCIFAMKPGTFNNIAGNHAKNMIGYATAQVKELYKERNITLKVVHVLFHWNAHSFFTYHKDEDGSVTVIVNLAPCEAGMHVAGHKYANYNGVG